MGILVQNRVTAGSRNCPASHWANNIRNCNYQANAARRMHYQCSAAFALFWNLCKSIVPDEIMDDFTSYLRGLGIGRMDADGVMPCNLNGKGSYHVEIEGKQGKKKKYLNLKMSTLPH